MLAPSLTGPEPDPAMERAAALLQERMAEPPVWALILGSGLGVLAEAVADPVIVEAAEIPGYPRSSVEGHKGRMVFGRLEGSPVVVVQGRVHMYEGKAAREAAAPVRLVHALGARRLLVTNAAGGITPSFVPGTLMWITDHINWTFQQPLVGQAPPEPHARAQPLVRPLYDPALIDRAEGIALRHGIATQRGTYLWTLGPSYETKAEIRAFARLGADAVGMSTVPEVIQARALGMAVLGLSTITNPAAGLSATPLSHEEVLEVGAQVRADLEALVRAVIREL